MQEDRVVFPAEAGAEAEERDKEIGISNIEYEILRNRNY